MAIEIKELHVNLHLNDDSKRKEQSNEKTCSTSGQSENEVIVENAVKQVLKILKEKELR